MIVGVPKEIKVHESRVVIRPAVAKAHGYASVEF